MKKHILLLLGCLVLLTGCPQKKSNRAGEKMQDFIIAISDHAREQNPNFILIPQNGLEVAFTDTDRENGPAPRLMDAIDGWGNEEVFYDGDLAPDTFRIGMLRQLVAEKKILTADYLSDSSYGQDFLDRCLANGFIGFPRYPDNYDYTSIPPITPNENNNNITSFSEAQNYLYLISDTRFSTRQEMIAAIAATNFDLVIIDLFFQDKDSMFAAAEIAQLKTKANGASRLVISYLNIGSAENYRFYWQDDWKLHKPDWIKKEYEGYPDEFWVKFWHKDWEEIIYSGQDSWLQRILNAGFDGAYLDNVEAYYSLYFDE